MNINQNHPKSFFKYMTASTAEKVLKTRTLRWSHPSEFDDTLDVARVCDEKMDESKQKQVYDMIIDLAANPPANFNGNNTNNTFKKLVSLLQSSRSKTSILEAKKGRSFNILSVVAGINKCWGNDIRDDFRILCLGIENNNHRLWNDYAEAYKGAVIELACREESDSPWRIAEPVEYVKEKELFLTAEDWAVVCCLESNARRAHYIIKKCCLKKAKDNEHKWSEQNEWRIPSFRRYHEMGSVSDYGVKPNDFSAVYFGHKMDIETQNKLLSLLKGELGHVSAFQCELDSSQNITFRKLK